MGLEEFYGINRVLEPKQTMPQQAWRIDNDMNIADNELLIDVEVLNIDSASFNQMKEEASGNIKKIITIILKTVAERGKQHNPVTGSGGMMIGRIEKIGKIHPAKKSGFNIGDEVATLVSLSLTPLRIDEIYKIEEKTGQVYIKGKAILFESGVFVKLPKDIPRNVSLAVLDVAGAPAQTMKIVNKGDTVVILGAGGKSGLLSLFAAKKKLEKGGKLIALEFSKEGIENIKQLQIADEVSQINATQPIEVFETVHRLTNGQLADITINCVNVPNTEMSSILATKDGGKVYFFSMATSFTQAALGAEGVGKDVDMLIGNGYTKNHAKIALNILRESVEIKNLFFKKYGEEKEDQE